MTAPIVAIHIAHAKGVTAVWLMGDFESICLADSLNPRAAIADALRLLRAGIAELRRVSR